MDYKKKNMSTDRENGRGNKRARVTRGARHKVTIEAQLQSAPLHSLHTRPYIEWAAELNGANFSEGEWPRQITLKENNVYTCNGTSE
jgi:hypothetical protein